MKKIRALHIASFNGNIGDNANHNGFRRKLKEYLKCDLSFDEIEIREFYQSWSIRDFNDDEFIISCNSYDMIIIGGGNFFELKWDYSYTGTTINISSQTLDKIKTPILFFGIGCDIAKGVSENTINKFEKFLDKVIESNKHLLSVRNDGSFETLNELYGKKYDFKIYKVPDGAFFLETKNHYYPEINRDLKSIGINVASDMKDIRFNINTDDGISYDGFVSEFAEAINLCMEKYIDYQIIFFPHIFSDLVAIYDVLDKVKDCFRRTRITVAPYLTGCGAEEYIFGLYKECEFILGMRFHSNVCSIAQGIPTIGLCSYKKIHSLYSEVNLLDRLIDVNKIGFREKLSREIEYLMENLESVNHRYRNVNNNIAKESDVFYQQIKIWAKVNSIL